MPDLSARIKHALLTPQNNQADQDISEQARQHSADNFMRILLAQFFTKLGDSLVSAKIVLPWLLSQLAAPTWISGLLVPIRESGSLLPQLFIGGIIRPLPLRKGVFVLGAVLQAITVGLIALVSMYSQGLTAGLWILLLLIGFSLARSLCSVASKDVLGKTIPRQKRGRLTGYSASLAGLVSILLGLALALQLIHPQHVSYMLLAAAVGWGLAALVYQHIVEYPENSDDSQHNWQDTLKKVSLLKADKPFRQFILVRSLLMSSALVAPYFVLLASRHADPWLPLGGFIILSGVADLISGWLWGRWADNNSHKVLQLCALLTCLCCLAGVWLALKTPDYLFIAASSVFLILSITHQGVRVGRKTYLVNLAEGNKRTDYVSLSNSIIGVLLLATGLLTALLAQLSLTVVFALLCVAALLAFFAAFKLSPR